MTQAFITCDPSEAFTVQMEALEAEIFTNVAELRFRDGFSHCSIVKQEDGFYWTNSDREGTAESFEAAWLNLPGFVTHPDHFEDSEVFEIRN